MVDYSAAPLKVLALDYTTVSVSWSVPTGSYTTLRLVRSQAGYPEHQEDGVILIEDYSSTVIRSSFTDGATQVVDTPVQNVPLVGGRFAHYSIWLRLSSDGSWVEAGRNYCLVPIEHSTKLTSVSDTALVSMHDKVMNYLPRLYTSVSKSPIDEIDPTSDLYRFLKAFSFTLDELLTYADLISPNPDIGAISPTLLETKLDHLNLESDALGATKSQKKLITNALTLYQDRGNKTALDSFITSLTSYPVTITDSPNMMLSTQSSSFNFGEDLTGTSDLGGWVATNGTTISYSSGVTPQITASSSTTGTVTTITITSATGTPQTNQSITGTNIPAGTYVTKVVVISSTSFTIGLSATTTGNLSGTYTFGAFTDVPRSEVNALQLPGRLYVTGSSTNTISLCSAANVFTRGIPVTPGSTYTVSYYIKEPANTGAGAQSKAKVAWYDSSGAQISTTAAWASYHTSTGIWSKATGSTFTAPIFRSYNPTRLGVASGVATLLFAEAHGFSNGEEIYISDINAPFAGPQTITGVTTHTITFNVSSGDVANTYDVFMTVESKQKVAYAIVSIETAATKTFYLDLIQFAPSTTTDFYEARAVDVYLNPTKANYVENPSFRVKTGTTVSLSSASGDGTAITYTSGSSHGLTTGQVISITGFSVSGYNVTKASITVTSSTQFTVVSSATGTATGTGTLTFNDWTTSGGTFSRPTATRSEQLVNGTVVGQIAISSSATPILTAVTDTGMAVGQYYTFSIYLRATVGTPTNVRLLMTATDGTTSKSGSFNNISLTSTWTRHSVTIYVPDTLVAANTYITSRITTAAAISSTTIQFDGAQLEDGFVATDYFDGSYSWAGASWAKVVNANSSYSYLYANKDSKLALLKDQITDWLPFRTPYIVRSKYGVEFSGVA